MLRRGQPGPRKSAAHGIRCQRYSGMPSGPTLILRLANSRLKPLRNVNRNMPHCNAGCGSSPQHQEQSDSCRRNLNINAMLSAFVETNGG